MNEFENGLRKDFDDYIAKWFKEPPSIDQRNALWAFYLHGVDAGLLKAKTISGIPY